jgi:hypothetical protein
MLCRTAERAVTMDAVVFWDGPGFWHVNERPSMRSLGEIALAGENHYTIDPDG